MSGGNQLQNIAIALTGGVANNRIANVNGVTYTYDASGNCTWDGAHGYAYDGEGRQVNVDSGVTSTSAYDSNNWRVKKIASGVTTHYVWEGAQVIAEYNGSTGALISEYIYAGSRMLARDQGGVLRYYHADRLSTRLITDSSGVVIGTEDHLPFGEDAGTTGETEKHRFTTYDRDSESGTDYAVNRQYLDPTGRFNRPDVFSASIRAPQSLNRYSYVANDPINSADPSGFIGESVWGLYFGTCMGLGAGGIGFGQEDYDFWKYRLADLPGFGTVWGSLSELEEWRYGVLVATKWRSDPAFWTDTDLREFDQYPGPQISNRNPNEDPYWEEITVITADALRRLESHPECRKLLSGFWGDAYKELDKLWTIHHIKSGDLKGDFGFYNGFTQTINPGYQNHISGSECRGPRYEIWAVAVTGAGTDPATRNWPQDLFR